MLQRDMRVKRAPQRFQDSKINDIDVCICFDERVFDLVLEGELCCCCLILRSSISWMC